MRTTPRARFLLQRGADRLEGASAPNVANELEPIKIGTVTYIDPDPALHFDAGFFLHARNSVIVREI